MLSTNTLTKSSVKQRLFRRVQNYNRAFPVMEKQPEDAPAGTVSQLSTRLTRLKRAWQTGSPDAPERLRELGDFMKRMRVAEGRLSEVFEEEAAQDRDHARMMKILGDEKYVSLRACNLIAEREGFNITVKEAKPGQEAVVREVSIELTPGHNSVYQDYVRESFARIFSNLLQTPPGPCP